jgi:hypothetical protein
MQDKGLQIGKFWNWEIGKFATNRIEFRLYELTKQRVLRGKRNFPISQFQNFPITTWVALKIRVKALKIKSLNLLFYPYFCSSNF